MRCSSSESGTPKSLAHDLGSNNASRRGFSPSVGVRGTRAPLLISLALDPYPVRSSQCGGHDGVVAEPATDVVDRPAGVAPPGALDVLEAELPGAVVDQVRDTHSEEPGPRRRVDLVEQ